MKHIVPIFLLFTNLLAGAQTYLSRQAALADIDTMIQVTEEVHFNPYRYISKEAFRKKKDSIKQAIGDSIEIKKFILSLSTLTALLEDGHAGPAFGQQALRAELLKKQFLPLALISDEQNAVYLWATAVQGAAVPKGAKILSVNGVNMQQFQKRALGYIGGLPSYKRELSSRLLSHYLFLSGVQPPFTVTYMDADKKQKKATLTEGVDFNEALSLSVPGQGQPPYTFKIIDNKVGYIDFVGMNGGYDLFMRFLDSAFRALKVHNIQSLAIDIRKNTGGNSIYGDILLAYLTDKPFSLSGHRKWKVSRQYKAFLRANGDTSSTYLQQKDGSVWQIGQCGPRERKVRVDTVYSGKVYLLTGPLTFSSANMLADGAKSYGLATLVGAPTGESTNDFGEVYTFILPNSKVRVRSTTTFDVGVDCNEQHHKPVMPHKLIKGPVQSILEGRDPVLEYVLGQVK